jgi:hypothetical protein
MSPSTSETVNIALISDTGGPAASATTFYYNLGSNDGGFTPTNSFGPGPEAVSRLVQSWSPTDLFAIGDLAYNAGSSTVQDISIGLYYNNFIHPYPSPLYTKEPYLDINGQAVKEGSTQWPYNIYNFPSGFPNPLNGGTGGSSDQRNHFWGALGNHDYGMAIGYGQVGVTPYNYSGEQTGEPIGPSSTTSVKSAIDYFLPYLSNPSLLGTDEGRINIGCVDESGNRGSYYSISIGGTQEKPLIEFFQLDTERLNINAGFEDWNPSGMKVWNPNTRRYEDEIDDNKDYSLTYDPSIESSLALSGSTTDPDNGFDQFKWLRDSLAKSQAKWKIITGHHPVYASGRWSDSQPDDHMSNPYLQRFLAALPEGAFHAYYNGHDHFYERVIESIKGGIGLGIPFITNGNSGRNLSKKIQVEYGNSVYYPDNWKGKDDEGAASLNPNEKAMAYLLQSNPIEVGASGLSGTGNEAEQNGFSNGLYGYGFGATRMRADSQFLLFEYQEACLVDPAIANHLSTGINPEAGFEGTTKEDWIPNPDGEFIGKSDLAQFELSIANGVVTSVQLINKGRGYMSSLGGNRRISGFNIYGNNIDPVRPWINTAQVDLEFINGKLEYVSLTDGGTGYELAVNAAYENNTANSTDDLSGKNRIIVALDYNINEIQYLVRDNSMYTDWYMIMDTNIQASSGEGGNYGQLDLLISPSSEMAKEILTRMPLTTGYSGAGKQQSFMNPQQGVIQATDSNGTLIAGGLSTSIRNGYSSLNFFQQPAPGPIKVEFEGDPLSSYLANFRESSKLIDISYGTWQGALNKTSPQSINFSNDVYIDVVRNDSEAIKASFGLRKEDDSTPRIFLQDAGPASLHSLNTTAIFTPSGIDSWLTSEGKNIGLGTVKSTMVAAGEWTPYAIDEYGNNLELESVEISGNSATAYFSSGIKAIYNTPGTGIQASAESGEELSITVKRLGDQRNGLAFYEADALTGGVRINGQWFLPGDHGYLDAALRVAKSNDLYVSPDELPAFGEQVVLRNLGLNPGLNYGLLLLRNNDANDMASSYDSASSKGEVSFISFTAPNRGVIYGIEDQKAGQRTHSDFNDLIVSIANSSFEIL